MNFHSSTQPYIQSVSVAQVGVEQRSLRPKVGKLPITFLFHRSIGKILILLLPLVLAINMYINSSISGIDKTIIIVDNEHHQLMDRNIELRAMKALLRDPGQLQQLAADKLELYVHTKGQVGKYNYRKGNFIYF